MAQNYSSSDLTEKIRTRTIYADLLARQQKFQEGCGGPYISRQGGVIDSTITTSSAEGAAFTSAAEQAAILANNHCPVATAAVSIVLKLLVLGDSTFSTVATSISSQLATLGYTNNVTITSRQLSTSETGSDLTIANYDVLLLYTNTSDYGTTTLFDNISTFITNGGGFVNASNSWRNYPTFPSANFASYGAFLSVNSAFITVTGVQQAVTDTMSVQVASVITTGVNVALLSGGSGFRNGNPSVITGGTKLATYNPSGNSLLAIGTKGTSRLVSLNIYIGSLDTLPNLNALVTNCVLYAKSLI